MKSIKSFFEALLGVLVMYDDGRVGSISHSSRLDVAAIGYMPL